MCVWFRKIPKSSVTLSECDYGFKVEVGTEKTEYWISLRDGRTNTQNDEVFTMLN